MGATNSAESGWIVGHQKCEWSVGYLYFQWKYRQPTDLRISGDLLFWSLLLFDDHASHSFSHSQICIDWTDTEVQMTSMSCNCPLLNHSHIANTPSIFHSKMTGLESNGIPPLRMLVVGLYPNNAITDWLAGSYCVCFQLKKELFVCHCKYCTFHSSTKTMTMHLIS